MFWSGTLVVRNPTYHALVYGFIGDAAHEPIHGIPGLMRRWINPHWSVCEWVQSGAREGSDEQ